VRPVHLRGLGLGAKKEVLLVAGAGRF
jgi:hypothetical protein